MRDDTFSGHLPTLLAKFGDRSAVIGIIGLGYACTRRVTLGWAM